MLASPTYDCCYSNDELEQLITNLVFHLGLPVNAAQLEQITGGVGQLNNENSMTIDEFATWFKKNVIAANPPRQTPTKVDVFL